MRPQLTHRNHFVFGHAKTNFSLRRSIDESWWVEYGRCQRAPLPFPQECVATAQLIRHSTELPLWVCLSGGVDSEVVALSFLAAGIDFSCAIMRFPNDLNEHDISWARKFCEVRGLPYRYFDIDPREFWSTRATAYAELGQCCSIGMTLLFWLAEQIPGYPIFGSGECHLIDHLDGSFFQRKKGEFIVGGLALRADQDQALLSHLRQNFARARGRVENFSWALSEKENIASLYRFLFSTGKIGVPGFFQFTPELLLSYLEDPLIVNLTTHRLAGSTLGTGNSEEIKSAFYEQYWQIEKRPKATGFEKLNRCEEFSRLQRQLFWQFGSASDVVLSPVGDLRRALRSRS